MENETPTPTVPEPPLFLLQVFDDVARAFKPGTITLADVTEITSNVSAHYGFNKTLLCVRVGLGPGKWAYVAAPDAPALREAHARWRDQHPSC